MDFFIPGVNEPKPADRQSDDASMEFKISSKTQTTKTDQTAVKLRKDGKIDRRKFNRAEFHGELLGVDIFKSKK